MKRLGLVLVALIVAGCQAVVAPTLSRGPVHLVGRGIGQSRTFSLAGNYYVTATESGQGCDPYPLAVIVLPAAGGYAAAPAMTGGQTHMHNLFGQFFASVSAGCDWTVDFNPE